jgi:hypothetical protein
MSRPPRDPKCDNLVTWRLISFAYLQIGIIQAIVKFFHQLVFYSLFFLWYMICVCVCVWGGSTNKKINCLEYSIIKIEICCTQVNLKFSTSGVVNFLEISMG